MIELHDTLYAVSAALIGGGIVGLAGNRYQYRSYRRRLDEIKHESDATFDGLHQRYDDFVDRWSKRMVELEESSVQTCISLLEHSYLVVHQDESGCDITLGGFWTAQGAHDWIDTHYGEDPDKRPNLRVIAITMGQASWSSAL